VGATERLVLFPTWLPLDLLGAGHVEHPWVRTNLFILITIYIKIIIVFSINLLFYCIFNVHNVQTERISQKIIFNIFNFIEKFYSHTVSNNVYRDLKGKQISYYNFFKFAKKRQILKSSSV